MSKENMLEKDFLSVADMAEILDVGKSMVRARALTRRVGQVIGGTRIFKQSDIAKMQPGKSGNFKKKGEIDGL